MAIITRPTDKVMNVNITYEDMNRPVAGPLDPFDSRKNKGMNSLSGGYMIRSLLTSVGHVEEQAMDDHSFLMQQRTFEVHGYALNPSASNGGAKPLVGSLNSANENGYLSIENMRTANSVKRETKRKRGTKGDASVVEGDGAYAGPWAGWEGDKEEDPVIEEEAEEWREEKRRREEATLAAKEKMKQAREEKSIFHGEWYRETLADRPGKELLDYAGRTYMHIPTDTDVKLNPSDGASPPNAYLPERCIHTWVSSMVRVLLTRRLVTTKAFLRSDCSQRADICYSARVWIQRSK